MPENLTEELFSFLKGAADRLSKEIQIEEENPLTPALLQSAIEQTLLEGKGKPVDKNTFEEFVIINLIIEAAEQGYLPNEIRSMVFGLEGSE